MKKTLIVISAFTFLSFHVFSQDLIKGLPISISLVPKSAKQPNLKLKDGSGVLLKYDVNDGIHVIMAKNGKQTDLCDPFANSKMVQVGQVDIENDGKPEIVVASQTSSTTIQVLIYKKADFEVNYQPWSHFSGVAAVEFPGDGTVEIYDETGNFSTYKFSDDGKLTEKN